MSTSTSGQRPQQQCHGDTEGLCRACLTLPPAPTVCRWQVGSLHHICAPMGVFGLKLRCGRELQLARCPLGAGESAYAIYQQKRGTFPVTGLLQSHTAVYLLLGLLKRLSRNFLMKQQVSDLKENFQLKVLQQPEKVRAHRFENKEQIHFKLLKVQAGPRNSSRLMMVTFSHR